MIKHTVINNPHLERELKKLKPLPGGIPKTKAAADALFNEVEQLMGLRAKPGRPRRGERGGANRTHSIRVPDAIWDQVSTRAKTKKITTNQAVALALAVWAESAS